MSGTYAQLAELNQSQNPPNSEVKKTSPKKPRRASDAKIVTPKNLVSQDTRRLGRPDAKAQPKNETKKAEPSAEVVEAIRNSVREVGYKNAEIGFTSTEHEAVKDLVYIFSKQGIRTSQVQIARIGVIHLINDHKLNGENSVLAKVLKALNS